MAMSASRMASNIQKAVQPLAPTGNDANSAATYQLNVLTAMCQAIITEITTNMVVTCAAAATPSAGSPLTVTSNNLSPPGSIS